MTKKTDFRSRMIRFTEFALVIFVWVVMLVTPVLFREANGRPLWNSVMNQLEVLVPLSVLYLINRFLLVPYLLFRGKILHFILSALTIILFLAFVTYFYETRIKRLPPRRDFPALTSAQDPSGNPERPRRQPRPVPPYANFLIFSVLIVGFDTGLLSGLRWINAENEKMRLEKENVAAQLTMLSNQVSPHFFMNTLNNIHALIDADSGEAKEAIIKLSKMMRYLLYETDTEKVTLGKEIEFLNSYIDLMKLRYSEKVAITVNLPTVVPDKMIPPFLFTSFIENAFKHGISYQTCSFVTVDMNIGKDQLIFSITNSKAENNNRDAYSGIGLQNVRKRLSLLYGDKCNLEILDGQKIFTINLSIPV